MYVYYGYTNTVHTLCTGRNVTSFPSTIVESILLILLDETSLEVPSVDTVEWLGVTGVEGTLNGHSSSELATGLGETALYDVSYKDRDKQRQYET